MSDYKSAVIDIGDQASKLAKKLTYESKNFCPAVKPVFRQHGNFRGPVGWRWKKHILKMMLRGNVTEEMECDGAGGKPQFFTLLNVPHFFQALGWEIITMCADDFARTGRFPAIMCNTLDVKKITEKNFDLFAYLIDGYVSALEQARLVNITGETAIMKHSVTAFCDTNDDKQLILNWSGTCVGLSHQDKLIDGSKIRTGMPIVGFVDDGYRCNGGTFFTNLIERKWGSYIEKLADDSEAMKFVKKLCIPSQSYARLITFANGWTCDAQVRKPIVNMTGIAHITGGGVWHKFREILPKGVGAHFTFIPPSELLKETQKLAEGYDELRLSDFEMYGTFHGGCGMLVICETDVDANILIRLANEHRVNALYVGYTNQSSSNEIIIKSQYKEKKLISSGE